MSVHYCHNCRYHALLPDGVYCSYCLRFFNANGHMPTAHDHTHQPTTMEALYARMGWDAQ